MTRKAQHSTTISSMRPIFFIWLGIAPRDSWRTFFSPPSQTTFLYSLLTDSAGGDRRTDLRCCIFNDASFRVLKRFFDGRVGISDFDAVALVGAALYSAAHFAALASPFPSSEQRTVWIVVCAVLIGIPFLFMGLLLVPRSRSIARRALALIYIVPHLPPQAGSADNLVQGFRQTGRQGLVSRAKGNYRACGGQ